METYPSKNRFSWDLRDEKRAARSRAGDKTLQAEGGAGLKAKTKESLIPSRTEGRCLQSELSKWWGEAGWGQAVQGLIGHGQGCGFYFRCCRKLLKVCVCTRLCKHISTQCYLLKNDFAMLKMISKDKRGTRLGIVQLRVNGLVLGDIVGFLPFDSR